MEIEAIAKELKAHELKDDLREETLTKQLNKEATKMAQPVNVFTTPTDGGGSSALPLAAMAMGGGMGNHGMAGAGAGLGAGLVGGLLGGLLFGGRGIGGIGGSGVVDTPVTTAALQSALNGQTAGQNTTSILQTLAMIQAAIPENEGKVQLAIAGAQADINGNIATGLQVAIAGQAGINQNVNNAIASSLASQSQIKDLILTTSSLLQLQASQNTAALNTAIRDDGDKTRGLIVAQNDTFLNRIITEQANELIELKNDKLASGNGLTITQTVNQAQAQAQAQQQQQQQLILLSQICQGLANVTQIAHATNSNVIAGNTGAVTTGAQTANPVNVAT
jgi:hypothetical protein